MKQVKNLRSANVRQLQSGKNHHYKHGVKVRNVIWLRRVAYAFLFIAVTVIVFQLLVSWM